MGTKAKREYKSVAQRAAEGKIQLIDPFDYIILGKLQNEGELLAGVYPVMTSVEELRTRHFDNKIAPEKISGRLRTMELMGLTKLIGSGSHRGWQRTRKGKEVFEQWQSQRSSSET